MKTLVSALLSAALALPAGDPAGFQMWTSAQLKGYAESLAPKMDVKTKVASETIFRHENYLFMAAHREGPGEAERHETQADIFVVQSGAATLVYGGSVVSSRSVGAGEIRGPAISGGMEKKLAAGDVVTIPAGMPHQLKLDAGKELTYFVVKVGK